jgi:hypothetical protein
MARLRIGSHKLNDRRTYIAMIIMLLLFASLILTVGILNTLETIEKTTTFAADPSASVDRDGIVSSSSPFDGIAIFAQVSDINLKTLEYSIWFAMFPQVYSY